MDFDPPQPCELQKEATNWAVERSSYTVEDWLVEISEWENIRYYILLCEFLSRQGLIDRTTAMLKTIEQITDQYSEDPEFLIRATGCGLLGEGSFQSLRDALLRRRQELDGILWDINTLL